MDTNLMYVARDGSYGDATDLLLVNATDFIAEDWEALDAVDDGYRREEATEIGIYRMADPIVWAWMTTNESAQVLHTLSAAIDTAIQAGNVGLAESLGDVRDVLTRVYSGIH